MIIDIYNLSKSYGKKQVLDDISIIFEKGKINAILGPNAAGKSTLIKCILGLVRPDQGDILVNQISISGKVEYLSSIGYVPQKIQFPYHLCVKDLIKIVCEIRNIRSLSECDLDLYHQFNIKKIENELLVNLSGGTLQKINAVIGFLFSPDILILDEPSVGLDPVAIRYLKQKIKLEKDNRKTVILTSHIPDIVEKFSDNIIFLHEGRVLFNNSLQALFQLFNTSILEDCVFELMKQHNKVTIS